MMPPTLRDVLESDLPILYEHQADPEAARVAAFASRDRDAFLAHWREKILGAQAVTRKAIVIGGDVAGNVVSWPSDGRRLTGYWLGRAFWGKGIATAALSAFVRDHERTRPLSAYVATSNLASIRVLEKVGFERDGAPTTREDGVEDVRMVLTGVGHLDRTRSQRRE
jgi:RimJ/RimL family protein N-acetyltransferase